MTTMERKKDYNQWIKEYATADFSSPKESTKALINFITKNGVLDGASGKIVLDYGAGSCSGLYQIAKQFPEIEFAGIDYNEVLISWVNDFWRRPSGSKYKLPNLTANFADWNDSKAIKLLTERSEVHAVMSVHALCTMKDCLEAISKLVISKPKHVVLNSLFYEGPLDVLIHIRELESTIPDDCPDADFNIHSIPKVQKVFADLGYPNVSFEKFNIGIDLKAPDKGRRGTYTIRTEFEERAQFSGPVYLPWYFVLASRS